jgi:hypothetical protein
MMILESRLWAGAEDGSEPRDNRTDKVRIQEAIRCVRMRLSPQRTFKRPKGTSGIGGLSIEGVTCPSKMRSWDYERNEDKSGVQWASEASDGVLFRQPGPGFLGEYHFVIVDKEKMIKKAVKITIVPARDPIK